MTWLAETVMLSHGWRRFLMLLVAGAVAGALGAAALHPAGAVRRHAALGLGARRRRAAAAASGGIFGPAFTIGFAFGLGYFTVAFHWLGMAFLTEGGLYLVADAVRDRWRSRR